MTTLIKDLFASDVTRDIPPVVYFDQLDPEKVQKEVAEYIITGGYGDQHPHKKRVPNGIHEQYVNLLRAMADALRNPDQPPDLPNAWISGFYGSGKSSFAKLLGLALDGLELPNGKSLAQAWLGRDLSEKRKELGDAWQDLHSKLSDPLSIIFDIGSAARDGEHIHATALRQLQRKLDYCTSDPLVADFELGLERRKEYARFEQIAKETLGRPWREVKDEALAEEEFSHVMHVMYPERYTDPMAWYTSRGGTHARNESPEDAVKAMGDMIEFRRSGAHVFFVIDEVSQYVLAHKDRVDRLRAFATALGSRLHGKVWLIALGQQKIDSEAGDAFLVWAKDRFPPKFRVHLEATNIRDVVHKRLLQKKAKQQQEIEALFKKHRSTLELYAYNCRDTSAEEFAEVYPMLPGHIDLLLQITSAIRTRSPRAQGDDQAIRGLLQLLGELFRTQRLADKELGHLVTLDQIYEVQHTALDSDVQASMARVLAHCADAMNDLALRAAKAVALLELLQDQGIATTAELVAQSIYDHVERGNQISEVRDALEALRRKNLLGYSEKAGYSIQSSAGEEWERERREMRAPIEARSDTVREALKHLISDATRPSMQGRPFPFSGWFEDGRTSGGIEASRDPAAVVVDFRYLTSRDARTEEEWVGRSKETDLRTRLLWVVGNTDNLEDLTKELLKSQAMLRKYEPRRESLTGAKKSLLQQERNNLDSLYARLQAAVQEAFMDGTLYFDGVTYPPRNHGQSFSVALSEIAGRILPHLFPHFDGMQLHPSEVMTLLETELTGISTKFTHEGLGILEVDGGRHVPSCTGPVVVRVLEKIKGDDGLSGASLLAHFGGPPFGYTDYVVKACVAGLLRGSKIRIQPDGHDEITAIRDAGVKDLFDKDRLFKRAVIVPAGDDEIGVPLRNRICRLFEDQLGQKLDREDHAIADAVARAFPDKLRDLRSVFTRLGQLPSRPEPPEALLKLDEALQRCIASCRQTKQTMLELKRRLDVLREGLQKLGVYDAELTADAIKDVAQAFDVQQHHVAQLRAAGGLSTELEAAAERLEDQLARERPWQEIASLNDDLESIREAYRSARTQLLAWQEKETEARKATVKKRKGFATLSSKQSTSVLRPLTEAESNTSADAVQPPLAALKEPFLNALDRAEEQANAILDGLLSQGRELIEPFDLDQLQGRVLTDEADVRRLLSELEERLLAKVRSGVAVRLRKESPKD